MDLAVMKISLLLVASAVSLLSLPGARAGNNTPNGCASSLDPLYFNLCDLGAVWGIVLEAFAGAGVVCSFILLIVLLASLPFVIEGKKKRTAGLQAGLLVCTAGLFSLTFDFIVGQDFSTCASRRFLFGVLFAGCFSCLFMHCIHLNMLARKNSGPRGWALCLGALALWLVEVIINTEWLIITIVRYPPNKSSPGNPCDIANQDFVMALIYVMVLILAVLLAAFPTQIVKHKHCRKEGIFIILTSSLSVGIWVAWIVMYVYGNEKRGSPRWDDPTLAIALVSNAWVFLLLYVIPEICLLISVNEPEQAYGDVLYPTRGVGYETILKEQSSQNMFVENKAFSMDEPNPAIKPVSPYGGYNGQMRSCVYQPTELALISKSPGKQADAVYDTTLPRAALSSQSQGGSSSTARAEDTHAAAGHGSGNGLYRNW
ncbi:G-protein coupled receptor family C group 5 member C isoform X1 [Lepisosteus oculatus]|uniref:G-protein coupled receptor family C group 5 member C isoform X1 n=1 Tax=Lepisosteus oculatus TaxID=7918 RepID=UPI00371F0B79